MGQSHFLGLYTFFQGSTPWQVGEIGEKLVSHKGSDPSQPLRPTKPRDRARSQTTVQSHKQSPISAMFQPVTGYWDTKRSQHWVPATRERSADNNQHMCGAVVERFPTQDPATATPQSEPQFYPLEEVIQSLWDSVSPSAKWAAYFQGLILIGEKENQ